MSSPLAYTLHRHLFVKIANIDQCARKQANEELYEDAINLYRQFPNGSSLAQAFLFFTRIYLSDDILVKSDRASMRVSLETRAIFLDNDLVDFCRRLPLRFKYRAGQRKYLLKKRWRDGSPHESLISLKKALAFP